MPDPIAEIDPALPVSLLGLITDAEDACRHLDAERVDSLNLETLARQLLRAESVASSRIEGLIVSHRRLAKADFVGGNGDLTAQFVLQNIRGMELALELATELPEMTAESICEIHRSMFVGTQDERFAGVVRETQNWIGGEASSPADAEFVPPPPTDVPALLDDLATFTNRDDLPALLQAAIAHVQFETIHPFADGNGRVGRALIHVVLRRRGVVQTFPPVSLALAGQADAYVKGLTSFRYGREDDWFELFASAVYRAAKASERFARQVAELVENWREQAGRPRADSATARLIDALPSHPIVNLAKAMSLTGASDEAVLRAFRRLEDAGVIHQTTVGRRNRTFESVGLFALMDGFERSLGLQATHPLDRSPNARLHHRLQRGHGPSSSNS